jgi:hypothetical protein
MTGVATELAPDRPAVRRSVGIALVAFGLVGLFVLGTALVFVGRPVDAREGPFGIETHRRQLLALLDSSRDAMSSAERAARDADGSLGSTAEAAGSAAAMMTELSTTMRALGSSLRVSVFGTQPFAPAAADMDRVADRAATVAEDLGVAASSVSTTAGDMALLADELAEMRREIDTIRGSVTRPIDAEGTRLLATAILAWLAIPAVVSLWLGARWLRPIGRPAPARDRSGRVRGPLRDPD